MASIIHMKHLPIFFFLLLLLGTLASSIQARDSQFFSKVTRSENTASPATDNYNGQKLSFDNNKNPHYYSNYAADDSRNNKKVQETEIPNLKYNEDVAKLQELQEQPMSTFTPQITQTSEKGYGLYGGRLQNQKTQNHHEGVEEEVPSANYHYYGSGISKKEYSIDDEDEELKSNYAYNFDQDINKEHGMKAGEKQSGYSTKDGSGGNSNTNKNYVQELQGLSDVGTSKLQGGAAGKQGMSDTRYLENGKYYYDANSERQQLQQQQQRQPQFYHNNHENYNKVRNEYSSGSHNNKYAAGRNYNYESRNEQNLNSYAQEFNSGHYNRNGMVQPQYNNYDDQGAGYQYKGNNVNYYNHQDGEEFEFDP